jgi:triacylglycerol lipase
MRRSVIATLAVALVFIAAACQTVRPSGPPSGRVPVLLVHGWSSSASAWDSTVASLQAAGYTSGDLTVFNYDTSLSAAAVSDLLAVEVDHLRSYTGAAKVDVVSHSFGSMVTRHCITLGSCAGKVSRWMSLGGADNGTSIANLCSFQASCQDMAGQTTTVADLQAAWPQIAAQNVRVEVQWSANDGVIIPATNSKNPAPAVNVEVTPLGHLALLDDPGVQAETIEFLDR